MKPPHCRMTDRADVFAVAGLVRGVASFEAAHLDGTRPYLAVADGADKDAVAGSLNAALLAPRGRRPHVRCARSRGSGPAHGLPCGAPGLPRLRPARWNRRTRRGEVRAVPAQHADLLAPLGAALGLITTRQILTGSDSFGDGGMPFIVPWAGLRSS